MPWTTVEQGELRDARQRLVASRRRPGATLSRFRIAPGARSMPLHDGVGVIARVEPLDYWDGEE